MTNSSKNSFTPGQIRQFTVTNQPGGASAPPFIERD